MQEIATQTASLMAAAGSSGMADLNWLFSASAQTAGAIVAIVGGFLITSLLGVESRFSGLKARRFGLETGMDEVAEQLLGAELAFTKNELTIFTRTTLSDIVRSGGNLDLDKLFDRTDSRSLTIDDVKDQFKDVCEEVREALSVLNKNVLGQIPLKKSFDNYRRMKGSCVPLACDETVWRVVYQHMLYASKGEQSSVPLSAYAWRKGEEAQAERQNVSFGTRLANLRHELDVFDAQYATTTAEAAAMNLPRGFEIALILLFVLSLVGIMLPLALLPFPSAGTGILIKWLVLVPFYSCIVAIFAWLRWASFRLKKELFQWHDQVVLSRSGAFEPAKSKNVPEGLR